MSAVVNSLSYSTLIKDRHAFRSLPTNDLFGAFDTPGHLYFKIFFYFTNGDAAGGAPTVEHSTGLIAPTWLCAPSEQEYYKYNSAWSYLRMNGENNRSELLKQFVGLLSDISTNSPWYFQEISGLDTALERDFKSISDERKKITIKCLQDASDNRIGTLLDLYRSIVSSWSLRREIVPTNLRKFDMGIFVYSSPILNIHGYPLSDPTLDKDIQATVTNNNNTYSQTAFKYPNIDSDNTIIGGDNNSGDPMNYYTSYKYFEFHNCEIDYNSSKSAYSAFSNTTGLQPEYSIDISFDDCYEHRYDERIMRNFGDFIATDLMLGSEFDGFDFDNDEQRDGLTNLNADLNIYTDKEYIDGENCTGTMTVQSNIYGKTPGISMKNHNGFLSTVAGQAINLVASPVKTIFKKAILGNLHKASLRGVADNAGRILSGNVMGAAGNIQRNIESYDGYEITGSSLGNIYKTERPIEQSTRQSQLNQMLLYKSNRARANTLANNI